MTEKDIQKISQEYKDEKAPLYEKVHNRVEEMYAQQAKKRKKLQTFYKFFPVALAMVLIVTLAIVLPIVLQPNDMPSGEDSTIWYSDADLTFVELDYSLKEYSHMNDESFLYIDLGELVEDRVTKRYYENENENATVYLQESFIHGEYGYFIVFTVMKSKIVVTSFDEQIKEPLKLNGYPIEVYYMSSRLVSYAQYEYDGYKYYIEIQDEIDESFLTEIIDNMFSTQQATA